MIVVAIVDSYFPAMSVTRTVQHTGASFDLSERTITGSPNQITPRKMEQGDD